MTLIIQAALIWIAADVAFVIVAAVVRRSRWQVWMDGAP